MCHRWTKKRLTKLGKEYVAARREEGSVEGAVEKLADAYGKRTRHMRKGIMMAAYRGLMAE